MITVIIHSYANIITKESSDTEKEAHLFEL